jgi:hypothetical protein
VSRGIHPQTLTTINNPITPAITIPTQTISSLSGACTKEGTGLVAIGTAGASPSVSISDAGESNRASAAAADNSTLVGGGGGGGGEGRGGGEGAVARIRAKYRMPNKRDDMRAAKADTSRVKEERLEVTTPIVNIITWLSNLTSVTGPKRQAMDRLGRRDNFERA